ncbi:MAG: polysaccharide deacetylase family protein [Planctomycetaceae bacterium]
MLRLLCVRAAVAFLLLTTVSVAPADDARPKRYLIIHADDAGMSHSVNVATIEGMEKGVVSSASIMVPCPWFNEIAEYARKNPDKDFGIHLTLNSEWDGYRWGPVAPREKVPSLLDKDGYLWKSDNDTAANGRAEEVEIELRAQIERARKFGVPVTHLDTHMGAVFARADFAEIYIRLGIEYNLPVLFPSPGFASIIEKGFPALDGKAVEFSKLLQKNDLSTLDYILQYYKSGPDDERKALYLKNLDILPPGISEFIIHC